MLAIKLATLEIQKLVNDVTSDKYLKDHLGYVNALAALNARKDWLKRIQIAGSPIRKRKINEKLAEKNA